MAHVVLGVGGGIAAYKVCEVLRLLTESGDDVRVVPTAAALRFVGAATWEALSGQPVATDVWSDAHQVPHVRIGQHADLVLVAPATADLLARAATGRADDLLTSTLLTARCPVVYAPAMHTEMWEHPATAANVATLRERGAVVVEPASGRLTGVDTGKGRLPEPDEIVTLARRVLARGVPSPDLAGVRVVVTAGGTREPLDPVRFLGNRSSGRQGYALARAAAARGASVQVVAANVALPDPAGAEVTRVETTGELRDATVTLAAGADVVIMAAAPCDFRPAEVATQKIKKPDAGGAAEPASATEGAGGAAEGAPGPLLRLVTTPDVAAEVGRAKAPGQVLVAFAAETVTGEEAVGNARAKLRRKGADLIVLNQVGPDRTGRQRGFGTETNTATVISEDGSAVPFEPLTKDELADNILDLVKLRLGRP